ncbi:sensor histidine kinase [Kocuria palustris]|uniref:sensor histidine kinase n=1 Tax=Kocuria palustris TaxID=71999 RepID=UPI0016434B5E|nr:histidine kinase N-terminal domain-containing protein [Kocuria palustris]
MHRKDVAHVSLAELHSRDGFSAEAVEHLHLLVGEWQVLADLGFGDVHLTFPDRSFQPSPGAMRMPSRDSDFLILDHARPGTAQTLFPADQIGQHLDAPLNSLLREVWGDRGVSAHRNTERRLIPRVSEAAQALVTTIFFADQPIAVLSLITTRAAGTTSAPGEATYREIAAELLRMAGAGDWPQAGTQPSPRRGNPRVGDGVIRLGADDRVRFMSPNAVSAVARLGAGETAVGRQLTEVLGPESFVGEQVDEGLMGVLRGRVPSHAEVRRGRSVVMFRSIPLSDDGLRVGAVLLCRDVSELRRRERELSSKDATIRETHHRVKNSLQAVAAMMRMQSRRAGSDEARRGLSEAMRRLEAVSAVHETLSHTPEGSVDFDEHFSRQIRAIAELAATGQTVRTRVTGEFGRLPGQQVTAMALVLNEMLTNAVEHGLRGRDGTIEVDARRRVPEPSEGGQPLSEGRPAPAAELVVTIADDGVGMDASVSTGRWSADDPDSSAMPSQGLGSQIVRSLVLGELEGSVSWRPGDDSGTVMEMTVPVHETSR